MNKQIATRIVMNTLGHSNDYLIRVLERYMNGGSQQRPINTKYREIEETLTDQIEHIKSDIELGNETQEQTKLLINTILKEKLADRSALETSQKHKLILGIVTLVLPIITNLIQFGISSAFKCRSSE